ncbi:hypothetical protein TSAR_013659 [Trichomalopsis sarcophagae]|uniref:Uncharacterized protein n=1 Tax=Trichomalopsis sarcophagae TaxID=543379 RepID=A0A232EV33_9HYME|nr:hypothetical protein TSAR_013659 [Trichomalopsis sarcophagae]
MVKLSREPNTLFGVEGSKEWRGAKAVSPAISRYDVPSLAPLTVMCWGHASCLHRQHIQKDGKTSQTIEVSNAVTITTLKKRKTMLPSKVEGRQETYAKRTGKDTEVVSVEVTSKIQSQQSSEEKIDPPWQEVITRKMKKKEKKRYLPLIQHKWNSNTGLGLQLPERIVTEFSTGYRHQFTRVVTRGDEHIALYQVWKTGLNEDIDKLITT